MNNRSLRVGKKGPRRVIPDLWESVLHWDSKTKERLEGIGIKNASRKQTRSLLAQFINDTVNDSEIKPIDNKKNRRRSIFLELKR